MKSKTIPIAAVAFALILTPIAVRAGEGKIRKSPNAVKGEYIVVLNDDTPRDRIPGIANMLADVHGGTVERVWQHALKGFFVRMSEGQARGLSHHPQVKYVEENAEMFLSGRIPTNVDPSCDPPSSCPTADNRMWHLDVLDQNATIASNEYASCTDGSGVHVYVIDTGVYRAHREFNNDSARVVDGYNASGDAFSAWNPCNGTSFGVAGHGTGVASLVAGINVGVAKNAVIVPVKVRRCDGAAASMTVQMTIEGLDWILRPASQGGNPYPKSPAVVTLSTFRVVGTDGVESPPAGKTLSLEDAIANLLAYDQGKGITVVASANNQNGNACDTSPGRMSRNNPNKPNTQSYRVITAGGTMIRNNPDPNPDAFGGSSVGLAEPAHDPSTPARLERWRCHAGDSALCTGNVQPPPQDPPAAAPNPITNPQGYADAMLGSNGGACVTLFAPAKNIPVADISGATVYRNPRINGGSASGTSWSAPIVAGMVARILQNNTTYNVDNVHTALMSYTTADLHTDDLNPPDVINTPNTLLHLTDVVLSVPPASTAAAVSGQTQLSVTATGAAPLTYQWYRVNDEFNLNQDHRRDAAKATPIHGATSATLLVDAPSTRTGYIVRVRSNCASYDSDIAVIFPRPATPANLRAESSGAVVNVTWSSSANADRYHLDRKVTGQAWQLAIASTALTTPAPTSLTDTAPPSPADGIIVYRVRASSGDRDVVAPEQRAFSNPSNLDFAYRGAPTDPSVIIQSTAVKAAHIIDLRKAINAIADAGDLPAQKYSAAELEESSLKPPGQIRYVLASDFTGLLTRLNALRTSSAYSVGSVAFATTLAADTFTFASQLEDLRNGLK